MRISRFSMGRIAMPFLSQLGFRNVIDEIHVRLQATNTSNLLRTSGLDPEK